MLDDQEIPTEFSLASLILIKSIPYPYLSGKSSNLPSQRGGPAILSTSIPHPPNMSLSGKLSNLPSQREEPVLLTPYHESIVLITCNQRRKFEYQTHQLRMSWQASKSREYPEREEGAFVFDHMMKEM